MQKNYHFEDFTEENYRNLLRLCKKNYRFILFDEHYAEGKNVLWRHDVDLSVHRARRLAQIENEENVHSTYFIHLHNEFYNALEKETAACIFEIIECGHQIGLHFDPNFYSLDTALGNEGLLPFLELEKNILEKIFHREITAFSFHNPDVGGWLQVDSERISGMINTYSEAIKSKYDYCSDSNGYWRFRRLENILQDASSPCLQVLTHPGWWTPEVMSPRQRVSRVIDGRAMKQHKFYDTLLLNMGRENIM